MLWPTGYTGGPPRPISRGDVPGMRKQAQKETRPSRTDAGVVQGRKPATAAGFVLLRSGIHRSADFKLGVRVLESRFGDPDDSLKDTTWIVLPGPLLAR